ncbi:hypothetical protein Pdw03_5153 [Penicillium digitatum]|uniref:Uncharacterized protein n=1 Tax=Penicillium digitatum TaxID=36651 RepID=A0A7T6XUQ9_PENDI|nr:hypothetical protein Pdw03_5153 [Penicillium digitatum]
MINTRHNRRDYGVRQPLSRISAQHVDHTTSALSLMTPTNPANSSSPFASRLSFAPYLIIPTVYRPYETPPGFPLHKDNSKSKGGVSVKRSETVLRT